MSSRKRARHSNPGKRKRSRFADAPAAAPAAAVVDAAAIDRAKRAALIQAQLAAQIASAAKSLAPAQQRTRSRFGQAAPSASAAGGPIALMLDAQGRQIDAAGNLVEARGAAALRTVKANRNVAAAPTRVNPYLRHRVVAPPPVAVAAAAQGAEGAEGAAPAAPVVVAAPSNVDERIRVKPRRAARKATFKFIEKGALVAKGDALRDRLVQREVLRDAEGKHRRTRGPALTFDTLGGAETSLLPSAALRCVKNNSLYIFCHCIPLFTFVNNVLYNI